MNSSTGKIHSGVDAVQSVQDSGRQTRRESPPPSSVTLHGPGPSSSRRSVTFPDIFQAIRARLSSKRKACST
jgi:hypothetical protein